MKSSSAERDEFSVVAWKLTGIHNWQGLAYENCFDYAQLMIKSFDRVVYLNFW